MGGPRNAPLTLRELRAIPVSRLTGVGNALEERLAIMGIESVLDVLQHYPRRYIDRTHRSEIAALTLRKVAELRPSRSAKKPPCSARFAACTAAELATAAPSSRSS